MPLDNTFGLAVRGIFLGLFARFARADFTIHHNVLQNPSETRHRSTTALTDGLNFAKFALFQTHYLKDGGFSSQKRFQHWHYLFLCRKKKLEVVVSRNFQTLALQTLNYFQITRGFVSDDAGITKCAQTSKLVERKLNFNFFPRWLALAG